MVESIIFPIKRILFVQSSRAQSVCFELGTCFEVTLNILLALCNPLSCQVKIQYLAIAIARQLLSPCTSRITSNIILILVKVRVERDCEQTGLVVYESFQTAHSRLMNGTTGIPVCT